MQAHLSLVIPGDIIIIVKGFQAVKSLFFQDRFTSKVYGGVQKIIVTMAAVTLNESNLAKIVSNVLLLCLFFKIPVFFKLIL